MKESFDPAPTNDQLRRIHDLLEAHTAGQKAGVMELVDGVLSVTLDSQLRLISAKVLDSGIDAKARQALEEAIVAAVNRAMTRVVQASAEALHGLRESEEFQRTAAELAQKFKIQPK